MAAEVGLRQLLRRQHGVIRWRQLRELGISQATIRTMIARGQLIRLHRGVYAAADPALLALAREAAALLSLGPSAVVSHRSAAGVWGIAAAPATVEVTVVARSPKPRNDLTVHRARALHPRDIRVRHNLRLTAPARTLIDLATVATPDELEAAFGEARAKRLLGPRDLEPALTRAPHNHPGAALVRRMLLSDKASTHTRSKAEQRMRALVKQAQLPEPLVNVALHGYTVDFLWPNQKTILEVDGYATHGDRLAFERDRRRDQVLIAHGYRVIRITWRQLTTEPLAVIARLAQALALAA